MMSLNRIVYNGTIHQRGVWVCKNVISTFHLFCFLCCHSTASRPISEKIPQHISAFTGCRVCKGFTTSDLIPLQESGYVLRSSNRHFWLLRVLKDLGIDSVSFETPDESALPGWVTVCPQLKSVLQMFSDFICERQMFHLIELYSNGLHVI